MPSPDAADALGAIVVYALLAVGAIYSPWLLVMRVVVERRMRSGTMTAKEGVALLRRLASGLLIVAFLIVLSAAPFSPFAVPNSHVLSVTTDAVAVLAMAVYAYMFLAIRRIGA